MNMRILTVICLLLIPLSRTMAQNPEQDALNAIDGLLELEYFAFKDQDDVEIKEKIKSNVRGQLKDPDSAQFKDLKLVNKGDAIYLCGKFNAKNAFGGYTGYIWFFASPIALVFTEEDELEFASQIIAHYCIHN